MREIRFGNQTNPAEDFHATIHDIKVVVQRMPVQDSLLYLAHGAPDMYKRATAYQIHFLRSLWVDHHGRLGLFIGKVKEKRQSGLILPGQAAAPADGTITYQFDTANPNNQMMWSKPGAIRVNREYIVAIGVVMYPKEFKGTTKVDLDGEVVHKFVVGDRSVF